MHQHVEEHLVPHHVPHDPLQHPPIPLCLCDMDHDVLPPANIAPQYANNDERSHPSRMHIMGIDDPLPPTDGDDPLIPLEVAFNRSSSS